MSSLTAADWQGFLDDVEHSLANRCHTKVCCPLYLLGCLPGLAYCSAKGAHMRAAMKGVQRRWGAVFAEKTGGRCVSGGDK